MKVCKPQKAAEKRASQDFHVSGFSLLTLFVQIDITLDRKGPLLLKLKKIKETN